LLMDRNEMSNLYRGSSIDASLCYACPYARTTYHHDLFCLSVFGVQYVMHVKSPYLPDVLKKCCYLLTQIQMGLLEVCYF
jgi:hypothetical protein